MAEHLSCLSNILLLIDCLGILYAPNALLYSVARIGLILLLSSLDHDG